MPIKQLENIDQEKIATRGDGKKYAVLMAGLKLFGEYGLKGTSVRMIADEANANLSAIPYYFTTKENLYMEVVKYIGQQVGDHMQQVKEEVFALTQKNKISKEDALRSFRMILLNMTKVMVEFDEPKAWAKIIMREQLNPTEVFDVLYTEFMSPMQRMGRKLVGAYIDADPESDEVKMRFCALHGQVLGFLVSRESILRDLGVKKLTQKHYDLIHAVIDTHIVAALDKPLIKDI